MSVKLSFIEAGYTEAPRIAVLGGRSFAKMKFPASVAVIEHPKEGVTLFDTGYSTRFYEATRHFPAKFYALITPVSVDEKTSAAARLKSMGIQSSDVKRVILSHFHADHVGGVIDFPKAKYLYLDKAYDRLKGMSEIGALTHAFLRGLLPGDFEARSCPISKNEFRVPSRSLLGLGAGYDLFGDGSVVVVELPGHAAGHIGLVIHADDGKTYLLAGDAAWTSESYERNVTPSSLAGLIFDNFAEYKETLGKLHELSRAEPDLQIVPCHCDRKIGALKVQ